MLDKNNCMLMAKYRGSSLRSLSPLEEQAHIILTPYAFRKFQEEFGRAIQYLVFKRDNGEYLVQYYKEGETQKHKVSWDGQAGSCACKHFEFWGILCRHILSVFIHEGVFTIPSLYFPLRWHRTVVLEASSMPNHEDTNLGNEDTEVAVFEDISRPPVSKTKGRPKQKHLKGGKELNNKQVKTCRLCKAQGHNYTTCSRKDISGKPSQLQGSQKKKKNIVDTDCNPVFHVKL